MLSKEDLLFPHSEIRDVQEDLIKEVLNAIENNSNLIAHAPTGLGKTAATIPIALSYALKNKKTVFFLTSRHTHHKLVIDTLKQIKKEYKIPIIATDIIGKKWMCLEPGAEVLYSNEFAEYCKSLRENKKCNWYNNTKKNSKLTKKAEAILEELKTLSPNHIEELVDICKKEKLCPYEMSGLLAKEANVIVGDYNYIFDPGVAFPFLTKSEKELKDSIIIVDEAHNLPKRVRDNLTIRLTNIILKRAIKEAAKHKFFDQRNQIEFIFNVLEELAEKLENNQQESLVTKEEFMDKIKETYDYDELITDLTFAGEEIRKKQRQSYLASIAFFLEQWPEESKGFARIITKKPGQRDMITELSSRCLDPSVVTKDIVEQTHSIIMISGTLTPTFMYKDILGFNNTKEIELENPFPKHNRLSLIIPETSTKYTRRSTEEFQQIAKRINKIADLTPGNTLVFFPSYSLRNNIYPFINNNKEILLEKRNITKEEKNNLLEEFKSYKDQGAIMLAISSGNYSIDYSEPILIKQNKKISLVKIGEFVDKFMVNKKNIKKISQINGELINIKKLGIRSACFGKNYKIKFKTIDNLIRHKINEPLYQLTLDSNRKVKTTKAHSVFSLEDGKIMPKKVSETSIGDYLVIPKFIPTPNKILNKIDLVKEFSDLSEKFTNNLYLTQVSKYLIDAANLVKLGYSKHYRYQDSIPLKFLRDKKIWKSQSIDNIKIGAKSGLKLNRYLKITKDFIRLLGYYVAEGHNRSGRHSGLTLSFGIKEKEIIDDAKKCIWNIFRRKPIEQINSVHKSAIQLNFGGKVSYLLFCQVLKTGSNAKNKRIPPLIFDLPEEYKLEFLKGYFAGDGTGCKGSEISCKTISSGLASDLMYLFLQLGIIAGISKIKEKERFFGKRKVKRKNIAYQVYITNINQIKKLTHIIPKKDMAKISKHIKKSKANKRRRTLSPIGIPTKESGLLRLYKEANPSKPRSSKEIITRIRQKTIRKDLFIELLSYIVKHARNKYDRNLLASIKKIVNGELCFAKVKKIEKCKPTSNYVYDISVKNYENFVGGFGGVILHNSEGIDLPGDFLKTVIVVGLPLEKPSLEIKELISYYDKKFSRGWDYGYVYPAIIKVLQNAGRCIRSETDKGVIVFLDERFAWESYYKCLPTDQDIKISKLYEKKIEEFFK